MQAVGHKNPNSLLSFHVFALAIRGGNFPSEFPHLRDSITSQPPVKNDRAILDSSGRLTTFEKPDQAIYIQDEGVKVEFKTDLTAFISSSTQSFYHSK